MILANGAILTARYEYSGFSDYWGGHGCANDDDHKEFLISTHYGRNTSLADIIDGLVEDSWSGSSSEDLLEEIDDSDVRDVLLGEMLNDKGRADYSDGTIAECSADYGADAECSNCGDSLTNIADGDPCPHCYNGDDYSESPIFIVVLDYEYPEPKVPPITVSQTELAGNGYTEIVDQDGCGGVTIRRDDGGSDVFQIRDSYAGWSLETDDGRCLEFCCSIG